MTRLMTSWHRWFVIALAILAPCSFLILEALAEKPTGSLVVIGRGPERPMIEQLAREFEKVHLGSSVDIRWNRNFHTAEMVRSGQADIAVCGRESRDLSATTIAWDGLAVIVNFSNPIQEVTSRQAASLFAGRIRDWSEVDERAMGRVRVFSRPDDQNLTEGFERSLGIMGASPKNVETIRSDQKVLSRVSGQLNAVSFMSLKQALDAVTYGLSVKVLIIDGIEPGLPTVQSGSYPIKRPVILLARKNATALAIAFFNFALSPLGQRIIGETYIPLPR